MEQGSISIEFLYAKIFLWAIGSCCVACSISSIAETRDRALCFFYGRGIHEVASLCLHHQWRFKSDTWKNRSDSPCDVSPHA